MDFVEVLNLRRSHRSFLDKKVDHSLIEQLMVAAQKAPVSCNLQVTQFVVVDDEKLLKELKSKVSYKFGYSPCSIVVTYDPRVTVERASVVSSSAMAAENILLQAVDLGLGTCPMAGFKKDELIKSILNIPSELEIALIIAVGYPDNDVYKIDIPKVDLKNFFSFNSYQGLESFNLSPNLDDQSVKDIKNYRNRISPVYLDRFRLHTWSEKYYKKSLNFFSENFASKEVRVLDVLSYDSFFLKLLHEANFKNLTIFASDYLESVVKFIEKKLGYSSFIIDDTNQIKFDGRFDVATLVLQANFTPELDSLLGSIYNRLESNGSLMICDVSESWFKVFFRVLKNLKLRLLDKKEINIYENNPFYRIGPRKNHSAKSLEDRLIKAGFKITISKVLHKNNKGVKLIGIIATKK